MRKFTAILILANFMMITAQPQTISPDNLWTDSDVSWRANGTTFANWQGDLYVFNYQVYKQGFMMYSGFPYVYLCNENHSYGAFTPYRFGEYQRNYIDNFNYPGENGAAHEPMILGNTFTFLFNDRLWYYQHVHSNLYYGTGGLVDESFQCFAQMPISGAYDPFLFYIKNDPAPDILQQNAFQLDSNLYFISRNENTKSSDYGKWYLQQYSYNVGTNKFQFVQNIYISNIPGAQVGGIILRTDSLGNNYIVTNTYDLNGVMSYLGKLVPVKVNNVTQFSYQPYEELTLIAPGATTIVQGTIRGSRTSVTSPTLSDRFTEFSVNHNKSSDGNYHLNYAEYIFWEDDIYMGDIGEIVLPTSIYPNEVDGIFNLVGSYELQPMDFIEEIPEVDGFQQWVWFFYPDHKGHFTGVTFMSDVWRVVPGSIVTSTDLVMDQDTMYGPEVRDLWSLSGILDGAPPASINWPLWKQNHSAETEPTELSFTTSSVQDTSTAVTGSFAAALTYGASISFGKDINGQFGTQSKYAGSIQSKTDLGTTSKQDYTWSFGMDSITQKYGYYLWMIPQIARYSYLIYPWWDNTYIYPISSTLQYLFRITGTSNYVESVPLSEYPFLVNDPNGIDLPDWRADSRSELDYYANTYLLKYLDLTWTDRTHGGKATIRKGRDSTSTFSWDLSYSKKYTLGIKIPKIFTSNISLGSDIKYSSEASIKTYFGNTVEASMFNMEDKEDGVNQEYIDINIYFLRPEDNINYWFYDSLNGQKPWYISYMVNECYDNIEPRAPLSGSRIKESELVFSWRSELGKTGNYTFIIATSPNISPSNIVYQEYVGSKTEIIPEAFKPEKGKTYYWAVKGSCPGGEIKWSESQSFSLPPDDMEISGMKAVVYPNPGRGNNIFITFDSKEKGPFLISLFGIKGKLIYRQEREHNIEGPMTIKLPVLNLEPGVYIVEIRTGSDISVMKLIIENSD